MEKDTYGWMLAGFILLFVASSMFMGYGHMGFGMVGGGFLFMILFLVFSVWLIVELAQGSSRDDALRTLKNRYAKGELSKSEFNEIKKELE